MKKPPLPIAGVVAVLVLVGVGVAVLLIPDPPPSVLPQEVLDRAGASQRVFRKLEAEPITNAENVFEILRRGEIQKPASISKQNIDGALRVAAQFLALRAAGDPEPFITWKKERGLRLHAGYLQDEKVRRRYTAYDKMRDLKAVSDPEDIFRAIFQDEMARYDSRARPTQLVSEPKGVLIQTFSTTEPVGSLPSVAGTPLAMHWIGNVTRCSQRHWAPPTPLEHIIARDGHAAGAAVSVICVGADGYRFPLHLALFHDPQTNLWWIEAACIANATKPMPAMNF